MLVDSHAHLLSLEDPVDAVSRAADEGIGKIISIGTGIESSLATIELSREIQGGLRFGRYPPALRFNFQRGSDAGV